MKTINEEIVHELTNIFNDCEPQDGKWLRRLDNALYKLSQQGKKEAKKEYYDDLKEKLYQTSHRDELVILKKDLDKINERHLSTLEKPKQHNYSKTKPSKSITKR